MEILRTGIRNILGIIIPGGFFCLLLLGGIFGVFGPFHNFIELTNNISRLPDGFLITILIILSYMAGNIIRLSQADKVDDYSAKYIRKKNKYTQRFFDALTKTILNTEKEISDRKLSSAEREQVNIQLKRLYNKYDQRIWIFEEFPYLKWQERKCNLYHTEKYKEFFKKYYGSNRDEYKEFFNFCKTVISGLNPELHEEINYAESLTRFFAGVYFSVTIGIRITLFTFFFQIFYQFFSKFRSRLLDWMNSLFGIFNNDVSIVIIVLSIITFVIFYYVHREILLRFRIIRLKEVDTVYDAFYVVCRNNPNIEL